MQVSQLRPSCVFEKKVYSSACLQMIRFKPFLQQIKSGTSPPVMRYSRVITNGN